MTRVLVAYATKHYSTAEIALAIAEELKKSTRLQVDIERVEDIQDISPYEAVVLGSAVYMGQWRDEAADFLKKYEAELAQRDVWIFSSGPVGSGDPKTLMKGWVFPEDLLPVADHIKPHDVALFHGKLERDWLNLFEKAAIKFVGAQTGDSRDWNMIRNWARGIVEALAQYEAAPQ
jgi:menaquinone-dependent protoporphyrinogen oxidase